MTSAAIEAPEAAYREPDELARDGSLSREEKLAALECWRITVMDRLAAANEGMPTHGKATEDLGLIEQIDRAVRRLETP